MVSLGFWAGPAAWHCQGHAARNATIFDEARAGLGRRPAARAHPHRLIRDAVGSRRDRRLHRPAPVGPRGPGGGPQAPRHVHRVDRQPRAAALPVRRSSTTRWTRRWPATAPGSRSTLHPDGSAEVRDNGRGIPVDIERKTKLSGVELVMTRLHAGGKFGGGSYTASGGLHGVGASVVNALAARLDVEVDREGHEWAASFRRGVTGEFAGPRAGREFSRSPGCASSAASPGGHRDPDQVLAGPAGVHQGRQVQLRRAHRSGPGRPPTWCPA